MKEAKRELYPSDLTDAQWEFIKPLLPLDANTGRPRNDDREVINGILYVLTTGCGWEYLPHDIETSWRTCHRRLLEYQRRRVWQKIVSELMKFA
jgi:transposase